MSRCPRVHGVQASFLPSSSGNKPQLVYTDHGDPMVPVLFPVTGEQGVWAWGTITDEGKVSKQFQMDTMVKAPFYDSWIFPDEHVIPKLKKLSCEDS